MKFLNEEGLRRVISWVKSKYIDRVSGTDATLSVYKGKNKQDIIINNVAHAINADTATKATQDSRGQQIDTTYVKTVETPTDPNQHIPLSNKLQITKGNGQASTITIDNVANAIKALRDKNGLQIDTNYLKLAGGSMQGLLELFAGSTVPTPTAKDKSTKVVNSEWVQTWVQSFVTELGNNIEVQQQEDGHFSCPTLGVSGLMAQNGYICLGKLFGGLILQWGLVTTNSTWTFPIGLRECYFITGGYLSSDKNANQILEYNGFSTTNLNKIYIVGSNGSNGSVVMYCLGK